MSKMNVKVFGYEFVLRRTGNELTKVAKGEVYFSHKHGTVVVETTGNHVYIYSRHGRNVLANPWPQRNSVIEAAEILLHAGKIKKDIYDKLQKLRETFETLKAQCDYEWKFDDIVSGLGVKVPQSVEKAVNKKKDALAAAEIALDDFAKDAMYDAKYNCYVPPVAPQLELKKIERKPKKPTAKTAKTSKLKKPSKKAKAPAPTVSQGIDTTGYGADSF